ncbi:hypothetical protein ACQ4PT_049722 [Festuca glaucescens]
MGRLLRPSNCIGYLLVLLALCCGTEHQRVEASNRLAEHPAHGTKRNRILTTVSVMKPSYPTVTTPTSASYAMPASTPMGPSSRFPSLADANGGGGVAGGGVGGGGAAGGGVGGGGIGGGGGGGGAVGGGAGGGVGGGGIGGGGGGGGGTWCVASQSASASALQVALDYACGYSGVDCSAIQTGGSCFNPDTIHDHASYAFNSYYQKNPLPTSCDFGGTATITTTDPSSGSCQYPASSGGRSGKHDAPAITDHSDADESVPDDPNDADDSVPDDANDARQRYHRNAYVRNESTRLWVVVPSWLRIRLTSGLQRRRRRPTDGDGQGSVGPRIHPCRDDIFEHGHMKNTHI